jgi:F-type H+-transporting ATPase subunit gamma
VSLKDIRERIHSIGSIITITSAMKLVSASKMKKTRDAIYHLDKYMINMIKMIKIWSIVYIYSRLTSFHTFEKKPILVIIIGSNRGLCGGFNITIFRQILNNYSKYSSHLITIGKKVKDLLINRFHVYNDQSSLLENICYNDISKVCDMFIYDFLKGSFHSIHLIYNLFKKTTSVQELISEKILPIRMASLNRKESRYLFGPSKKDIIFDIITKNIKTHICKAILASFSSEQSSRMKAMHQYTDNASKLKISLLLIYNKARQTAITKEIIEIMSGVSIYV